MPNTISAHEELLRLTETDPFFREAPHARLDELRSQASARSLLGGALVFITDYTLAKGVLENDDFGKTSRGANPTPVKLALKKLYEPIRERYGELAELSYLDGNDHKRVRGVISKAFALHFSSMRQVVDQVVAAALENIGRVEKIDVISEYAKHIPVAVVARLIGISLKRVGEVREAAELLIPGLVEDPETSASQQRVRGVLSLQAIIADALDDRRSAPADDMTSTLLQLQREGAPITDTEIRDGLLTFLYAGHISTTMLIGNAIYLLLSHPDQMQKLRANPELIGATIEEALRYEPPVTRAKRYAAAGRSLAQCPHNEGAGLVVSLQAANRDPHQFDDPHAFDITRSGLPHISFGGGRHLCLGAQLARLEAQQAVARLLERFPELHLATDFSPEWQATPGFRGLRTLSVEPGT